MRAYGAKMVGAALDIRPRGGGGTAVTRTRQEAARHGRVGCWTSDDLEVARLQANLTARPWGDRGPTPGRSGTAARPSQETSAARSFSASRECRPKCESNWATPRTPYSAAPSEPSWPAPRPAGRSKRSAISRSGGGELLRPLARRCAPEFPRGYSPSWYAADCQGHHGHSGSPVHRCARRRRGKMKYGAR